VYLFRDIRDRRDRRDIRDENISSQMLIVSHVLYVPRVLCVPLKNVTIHLLFFVIMIFRPVRDDMLVENDVTNRLRPVGMQCW
jgi:hypothetical protein